MKRILCLVLALVLCGAMAFAESDLDAANARIAELEAEVALYKPFYEAQIAAEYAGGVLFVEDVMAEYNEIEQMYMEYYGMSLADYGYDAAIKQDLVKSLTESAICALKASELGLDQLDEETMAGLEETAQADLDLYILDISSQMLEAGAATEENVRDEAIAYLETAGYTYDIILETLIENYINEQLYNHVTADVAVTEEDIQAYYDDQLATEMEDYSIDANFTDAYTSGAEIIWYPEGYRSVKHVLIQFDDEQTTRYNELDTLIASLNDELTAEVAEDAETEKRSEDEINADLAAAQADLDALYAELAPVAQEVIDKYNDGTDFDTLIAEYNDDPGMNDEIIRAKGYALTEGSGFVAPFLEAALALENIGDISAPVNTSFGVHVIVYNSDITAGPVPLDDVRDFIEPNALEAKLSTTYSDAVASWIDAAAPTYYFNRVG